MKTLKILFTVCLVFVVGIISAQLDTLANHGQDIIDEVGKIETPLDLLTGAEMLIGIFINLMMYIAGRFGWLKNVSKIAWVAVGVALVLGGGAIGFGLTTWIGAVKAYVFSTSFYSLILKNFLKTKPQQNA